MTKRKYTPSKRYYVHLNDVAAGNPEIVRCDGYYEDERSYVFYTWNNLTNQKEQLQAFAKSRVVRIIDDEEVQEFS